MKYCCNEFEIVAKNGGIIKQYRGCPGYGKWVTVGNLFCKFCPFCGKDLGPRFKIIASNILGYAVRDEDHVVAYFESLEAARAQVERLCK